MAESEDIAQIEQVKYRYLRALDTKNWEAFAATLTPDVVAEYGASRGKAHQFTDRDAVLEFLRESLNADVISEHRVTHPEITLTGPDTATGLWYLQDRVIVPRHDFMLIGAAFYNDEYRRTDEGWKMSATGYERTYEASMALAGLGGFTAQPGAAVHR